MGVQSGKTWLIALGCGLAMLVLLIIVVKLVAENFPWSGLGAD